MTELLLWVWCLLFWNTVHCLCDGSEFIYRFAEMPLEHGRDRI